jgi:hypothetical protein
VLARPLATAGRGRAEAEDPARAGERFTYEALAGRLGDAEIAPPSPFFLVFTLAEFWRC